RVDECDEDVRAQTHRGAGLVGPRALLDPQRALAHQFLEQPLPLQPAAQRGNVALARGSVPSYANPLVGHTIPLSHNTPSWHRRCSRGRAGTYRDQPTRGPLSCAFRPRMRVPAGEGVPQFSDWPTCPRGPAGVTWKARRTGGTWKEHPHGSRG